MMKLLPVRWEREIHPLGSHQPQEPRLGCSLVYCLCVSEEKCQKVLVEATGPDGVTLSGIASATSER